MLQEISNGLNYLNLAGIYTQRLDWLFSGDDGEYNFFERLEEEVDGVLVKKAKRKQMSIKTKWWKLVQISFIIFLCCAMYDVWVGFDDNFMSVKLLLTTLFVMLIGHPIISFMHNFKKENK